jgi:CheY-like chemotaxis protein
MSLPPVVATILSGRLDSGRMAMKRVLLVEDHAAFREALAKVLEWKAGFFEKVPQAGSLGEGLARAGVLDGALHAAVVNLGLPDGDGTDLISQMRSTESDDRVRRPGACVDPEPGPRASRTGSGCGGG